MWRHFYSFINWISFRWIAIIGQIKKYLFVMCSIIVERHINVSMMKPSGDKG